MQQCLNIASGFVTIGEAALQGQTSERAAVALSSLGMRPDRGDRSLNHLWGPKISSGSAEQALLEVSCAYNNVGNREQ